MRNEQFKQQEKQQNIIAPRAERLMDNVCPNCGCEVLPGSEICPCCGYKMVDYCTFCGADIPHGVDVCPECGANAHGIRCSKCGTVSFRAFCSHCNEPLTKVALKAVEKAQKDPLFIKAQELYDRIEALSANKENDEDSPEYANEESPSEITELDLLKQELREVFEKMTPPENSTPQQKRNYYCARKVQGLSFEKVNVEKEVVKTVKKYGCVGWVCNLCGMLHSHPAQCVRPELGGNWIYGDYTANEIVKVNEIQKKMGHGSRTIF